MAIIGSATVIRAENASDLTTIAGFWGAGDEGKYVDIYANDILHRWDGSAFQEAAALADRLIESGGGTYVFSEDGSNNAVMTASGGTLANDLFLYAPNSVGATGTLAIGKYGNIAISQGQATDTVLLNFQKLNYTEAATVSAINGSIEQLGTGAIIGFNIKADLDAASANSNECLGGKVTSQITDKLATGNVTGLRITTQRLGTPAAVSGGDIVDLDITPASSTFFNISNIRGVLIRSHLMSGGTVTNNIGVDILSQSSGTNKWSVRGQHKFECLASDFIASTNGKGTVMVDAQGTPHYWRFQVDGTDGIPYVEDIGTTAPAT